MKVFSIRRAVILALLLGTAGHAGLAKEAPKGDDVIATVNGTDITIGDIQLYMSTKATSGAPADPGSILNEVINRELIKQAAIKEGIDKEDDFKKAMEIQRTNLLVNAALSKRMDKVDLSDAALKKAYEEEIKNAPGKEYKARHILLKTEDEAKAVIKSLNDGGDFVKLAKEKSIGPSGPNGGDLGWFQATTMVKEFAAAVEKLEKGKITQTPVKTQFGWHVIKLEDSRKLDPPSFESSKDKLRSVVANKAIQSYLEELHKNAKVELTQPPGTKPAEKKGN
jgi:peptidyl-prolyl cis-trans isomerase C